jgi:nucleotide-binding universal stress UspA family protein
MFRTILVAVDGSTGNERILLYAEHLARLEQAALVVVHAYRLPTEYEWTDGYEGLQEQYGAIAAEVVKDALEVVGTAGQEATPDVRQGAAAEAILAAAHTHAADLIILGSRTLSREPVAEALLGSVATMVLRNAACPVLVVP